MYTTYVLPLSAVALGLWTLTLRNSSFVDLWSVPNFLSQDQLSCSAPDMRVRFLSYDPILIYIENFVSANEAKYLTEMALPYYRNSTVASPKNLDTSLRNSLSAALPDDDPVVRCVRSRAAEFQGFKPVKSMETLQAVKYSDGQYFKAHIDPIMTTGTFQKRVTSFFVILEASCTGGETAFPKVRFVHRGKEDPWCDYLVCDDDYPAVAFKPRVGGAVFWVNHHPDGTPHEGTLHSGQPVWNGTKVGLNIWTASTIPS